MRIPSNRCLQNNLTIYRSSGRAIQSRRTQSGRLTLGNMFMALLVTFVAVAAMQAQQLNSLLSDTKAIGRDVMELREDQENILNEYTLFDSYLSNHVRN